MLVKTDATPPLGKKALTRSIIALEAAVDLDKTYSATDKVFLRSSGPRLSSSEMQPTLA